MKHLKVVELDFGFDCKPIAKKEKRIKPTKADKNDFVFDVMDCLASPIIVFKSAWQDSIPPEILGNIKTARLLSAVTQDNMASLTETLAYMMPRTFEAPMPVAWVHIYTWLGLQYAIQFNKKAQLQAMTEIAPKALSEYEKELLTTLRKWIFENRRKALAAILKAAKISKSEGILEIHETLF